MLFSCPTSGTCELCVMYEKHNPTHCDISRPAGVFVSQTKIVLRYKSSRVVCKDKVTFQRIYDAL